MRFDARRHQRRSIRLEDYDYRSAGAYFVTLCTRERECVLDDPIVQGIILDVWQALPARFPTIALDAFVVMPNHVHLIVWLHPPEGSERAGMDQGAVAPGADSVGATLAVAPNGAAPRTDAEDVGATLAVAPDSAAPMADDVDVGATLAVAPDSAAPMADDEDVGATLAVAPDSAAPMADDVRCKRAGASPAPTAGMVTPGGVAPMDGVGNWVVPEPDSVNSNPRLGDVIGAFKSLVFVVYLDWIERNDPSRQAKFWQRNYYEHIIRNQQELRAIRQYITDNPARWAWDTYNPDATSPDPRAMELWQLLQGRQ